MKMHVMARDPRLGTNDEAAQSNDDSEEADRGERGF